MRRMTCAKSLKRRAGFTMIELMVALSLSLVVGYAVFYMYTQSIDTYSAAEVELKFLSGFRTSTDFIEREVNSMCWKGGYLPVSGGGTLKKINDGMFTVLLDAHVAAFYTSLDGVHIDRVAYYFNPPEDQLVWEDDEDSDNDDPELMGKLPMGDLRAGLYLLIDDKGCFVRRKWQDKDLTYADYSNPLYMQDLNTGLPTFALPVGMTGCNADLGEIMAEGFTDISFWYVFTKPNDKKLYYAEEWPYDDDLDPKSDQTGVTTKGIIGASYLTVPLGIQIDFHYDIEGTDRVLSKLMLIYSSRWQEILTY